MRVQSSDTFAGFSAKVVRDCMRQLGGRTGGWSPGDFGNFFSITRKQANNVVKELSRLGLIERRESVWGTTVKGNALASARFTRPVSRSVAQRHLDGLLERAQSINANPDYLYVVAKLILFGSFLRPEVDPVGDVDIAYELKSRPMSPEEFERRRREKDEATTRRFANIVERYGWPQTEVVRALTNRSRVLSLTTTDDGILERVPTKVIYLYSPN